MYVKTYPKIIVFFESNFEGENGKKLICAHWKHKIQVLKKGDLDEPEE